MKRNHSTADPRRFYICSRCGKTSHIDRKGAKKHARQLRQREPHGVVLDTYRCPVDNSRWHVGHSAVRQRLIDEEGGS